jgi:crossover junction endodeoxyribonuclease RuvC
MVILGIDPGTATTGYGLIRKSGKKRSLKYIKCGLIETESSLTDAKRLKIIYNEIIKLIRKHKPKALAVERLYFFKNLKTAMTVSQAKGVILLAAAKKKLPIYEFTPLQVKMAITNYGRADKKQMQRMIKALLNLKKLPPDDAADALGTAICCANSLKTK